VQVFAQSTPETAWQSPDLLGELTAVVRPTQGLWSKFPGTECIKGKGRWQRCKGEMWQQQGKGREGQRGEGFTPQYFL